MMPIMTSASLRLMSRGAYASKAALRPRRLVGCLLNTFRCSSVISSQPGHRLSPSGPNQSLDLGQSSLNLSGKSPSTLLNSIIWASHILSSSSGQTKNSWHPVTSSYMRHPKLQISIFSSTCWLRTISGARKAAWVTSLSGGWPRKKAVAASVGSP